MAKISETEKAYVNALLHYNVLQKIESSRLPIHSGVIMVCCGDCDQFPDRMDYLRRKIQELGYAERPHFLTRHGGALRIVHDSQLNKPGRTTSEDLLDEIEEAVGMKAINTVFLEIHGPCGKRNHHHMDMHQALIDLCRAKTIVFERFPNALPIKVMHIDWGHEKHYYKVSGEEFNKVRHHLEQLQATA